MSIFMVFIASFRGSPFDGLLRHGPAPGRNLGGGRRKSLPIMMSVTSDPVAISSNWWLRVKR